MKSSLVYIIIFLVTLSSCKTSTEPDNKNALDRLVKNYPKMYGGGQLNEYKLKRKFYNIEDSIEMQLLEADHGDKQIVILSNYNGAIYALPFPNNDEKSYWMFYGQKGKLPNSKSFNSEMTKAFQVLSIKNDYKVQSLFNEILVSLLKCRPIFPNDSMNLKKRDFLPDSCSAILKNNYKDMQYDLFAAWRDGYTTFNDQYRIFQIQGTAFTRHKKKLKFVVYEDPCVVKGLYL